MIPPPVRGLSRAHSHSLPPPRPHRKASLWPPISVPGENTWLQGTSSLKGEETLERAQSFGRERGEHTERQQAEGKRHTAEVKGHHPLTRCHCQGLQKWRDFSLPVSEESGFKEAVKERSCCLSAMDTGGRAGRQCPCCRRDSHRCCETLAEWKRLAQALGNMAASQMAKAASRADSLLPESLTTLLCQQFSRRLSRM